MFRRGIAAAVIVAAALTGCSRLPDDPGPTPADLAEDPVPTDPPISVSPPPQQAGVPVDGCPTKAQVLTALTEASAIPADHRGLTVPRPTCAGDWAGVTVTASGGDPMGAVLQRLGGRLFVTVAGSTVCADPAAANAPATVRTAAGC
jgi:hypothetical protein